MLAGLARFLSLHVGGLNIYVDVARIGPLGIPVRLKLASCEFVDLTFPLLAAGLFGRHIFYYPVVV